MNGASIEFNTTSLHKLCNNTEFYKSIKRKIMHFSWVTNRFYVKVFNLMILSIFLKLIFMI